jgi:hypothetical protein
MYQQSWQWSSNSNEAVMRMITFLETVVTVVAHMHGTTRMCVSVYVCACVCVFVCVFVRAPSLKQ